jgi:hypothetical protein
VTPPIWLHRLTLAPQCAPAKVIAARPHYDLSECLV